MDLVNLISQLTLPGPPIDRPIEEQQILFGFTMVGPGGTVRQPERTVTISPGDPPFTISLGPDETIECFTVINRVGQTFAMQVTPRAPLLPPVDPTLPAQPQPPIVPVPALPPGPPVLPPTPPVQPFPSAAQPVPRLLPGPGPVLPPGGTPAGQPGLPGPTNFPIPPIGQPGPFPVLPPPDAIPGSPAGQPGPSPPLTGASPGSAGGGNFPWALWALGINNPDMAPFTPNELLRRYGITPPGPVSPGPTTGSATPPSSGFSPSGPAIFSGQGFPNFFFPRGSSFAPGPQTGFPPSLPLGSGKSLHLALKSCAEKLQFTSARRAHSLRIIRSVCWWRLFFIPNAVASLVQRSNVAVRIINTLWEKPGAGAKFSISERVAVFEFEIARACLLMVSMHWSPLLCFAGDADTAAPWSYYNTGTWDKLLDRLCIAGDGGRVDSFAKEWNAFVCNRLHECIHLQATQALVQRVLGPEREHRRQARPPLPAAAPRDTSLSPHKLPTRLSATSPLSVRFLLLGFRLDFQVLLGSKRDIQDTIFNSVILVPFPCGIEIWSGHPFLPVPFSDDPFQVPAKTCLGFIPSRLEDSSSLHSDSLHQTTCTGSDWAQPSLLNFRLLKAFPDLPFPQHQIIFKHFPGQVSRFHPPKGFTGGRPVPQTFTRPIIGHSSLFLPRFCSTLLHPQFRLSIDHPPRTIEPISNLLSIQDHQQISTDQVSPHPPPFPSGQVSLLHQRLLTSKISTDQVLPHPPPPIITDQVSPLHQAHLTSIKTSTGRVSPHPPPFLTDQVSLRHKPRPIFTKTFTDQVLPHPPPPIITDQVSLLHQAHLTFIKTSTDLVSPLHQQHLTSTKISTGRHITDLLSTLLHPQFRLSIDHPPRTIEPISNLLSIQGHQQISTDQVSLLHQPHLTSTKISTDPVSLPPDRSTLLHPRFRLSIDHLLHTIEPISNPLSTQGHQWISTDLVSLLHQRHHISTKISTDQVLPHPLLCPIITDQVSLLHQAHLTFIKTSTDQVSPHPPPFLTDQVSLLHQRHLTSTKISTDRHITDLLSTLLYPQFRLSIDRSTLLHLPRTIEPITNPLSIHQWISTDQVTPHPFPSDRVSLLHQRLLTSIKTSTGPVSPHPPRPTDQTHLTSIKTSTGRVSLHPPPSPIITDQVSILHQPRHIFIKISTDQVIPHPPPSPIITDQVSILHQPRHIFIKISTDQVIPHPPPSPTDQVSPRPPCPIITDQVSPLHQPHLTSIKTSTDPVSPHPPRPIDQTHLTSIKTSTGPVSPDPPPSPIITDQVLILHQPHHIFIKISTDQVSPRPPPHPITTDPHKPHPFTIRTSTDQVILPPPLYPIISDPVITLHQPPTQTLIGLTIQLTTSKLSTDQAPLHRRPDHSSTFCQQPRTSCSTGRNLRTVPHIIIRITTDQVTHHHPRSFIRITSDQATIPFRVPTRHNTPAQLITRRTIVLSSIQVLPHSPKPSTDQITKVSTDLRILSLQQPITSDQVTILSPSTIRLTHLSTAVRPQHFTRHLQHHSSPQGLPHTSARPTDQVILRHPGGIIPVSTPLSTHWETMYDLLPISTTCINLPDLLLPSHHPTSTIKISDPPRTSNHLSRRQALSFKITTQSTRFSQTGSAICSPDHPVPFQLATTNLLSTHLDLLHHTTSTRPKQTTQGFPKSTSQATPQRSTSNNQRTITTSLSGLPLPLWGLVVLLTITASRTCCRTQQPMSAMPASLPIQTATRTRGGSSLHSSGGGSLLQ